MAFKNATVVIPTLSQLKMNELTEIKIFGNGRTEPKVNSGIEILLIQNGIVQVGKLNLGNEYEFDIEIEHPKNEKELNIQALKLIKEKKTEYLKRENSTIIICPKYLSKKMKWS